MQRTIHQLLFFGLAVGISQASAQTVTNEATGAVVNCNSFSGNVLNHSKPVTGVSVMVVGTNIVLITNEDGFFTLPERISSLPVLSLSAAGYAPQRFTYTSCAPAVLEMQLLPGTRIRKHGKRKGQIKKDGIIHN